MKESGREATQVGDARRLKGDTKITKLAKDTKARPSGGAANSLRIAQ